MLNNYITKEEINQLPIGQFEGEVVVIDKLDQVSTAVQEIGSHELIGFDTETKPSFQKGKLNQVSLAQFAVPGKAFLFRVKKIGLTDEMVALFTNPHIKKIGLAIRDDIKDLQKLKPFEPEGFVELSDVTRELGIVNAGARGLAGLLLNIRISKAQQTSNWENAVLTRKQIKYAATDAWVCLEIYRKLMLKGYVR
ncbi:3'-5' exonuclease [Fulvivirgaceae bacterium BMA12]|uniref:3'-5' exonuclease n=1 Tax=Agaribacillus aureus TaxID=3051825 RepID=A0ABT8L414_9BACT|nr:3'-5' exonuclease [Fulvivirgaceae bacterium BMA12]